MNERLKELRKRLGLTQQEFAERLGIKRNAVTNYEVGRNAPADMVVSLICREFNVSEQWLRTGEGEPFVQPSRDKAIEAFCQEALRDEDESFRRRFVAALAALDVSDWEVIEKFVSLIEKNKKEKPPETEREKIIKELDRQLQEEDGAAGESAASTVG